MPKINREDESSVNQGNMSAYGYKTAEYRVFGTEISAYFENNRKSRGRNLNENIFDAEILCRRCGESGE